MCGLLFSRVKATEFFLKASPCLGEPSALQSPRDRTWGQWAELSGLGLPWLLQPASCL